MAKEKSKDKEYKPAEKNEKWQFFEEKFILGKNGYELFKDEDKKIEKLYRVKRVVKNEVEKWHIYENKNSILSMEVSDFEHPVDYLRTPEGFVAVLKLYKEHKTKAKLIKAINEELASKC